MQRLTIYEPENIKDLYIIYKNIEKALKQVSADAVVMRWLNRRCMKKAILKQSGVTVDGNPVVSNVFKLSGTLGIPLDLVLSKFKEGSIIIDWVDYIKCALKDGTNLQNIKARILAAIGDVYGPIYKNEIENRLNFITLGV